MRNSSSACCERDVTPFGTSVVDAASIIGNYIICASAMKSKRIGRTSHDSIRGGFVVVGSLLHHPQSPRLKLKRKLSDRNLKWPAQIKSVAKKPLTVSSPVASSKTVCDTVVKDSDKWASPKTECPIKLRNSQCECGVPGCKFVASHVCMWEKYQKEEDEHVREMMVGEALSQNKIMKEKIRLLKAALGIN